MPEVRSVLHGGGMGVLQHVDQSEEGLQHCASCLGQVGVRPAWQLHAAV